MRGLVKEHLDSYNYFIDTGIKKIVRVNNEIRSTIDREIYLKYLFQLLDILTQLFSFVYHVCSLNPYYLEVEHPFSDGWNNGGLIHSIVY